MGLARSVAEPPTAFTATELSRGGNVGLGVQEGGFAIIFAVLWARKPLYE